MKYLILKRAASKPSVRNHCRPLPKARLCPVAASSYLLCSEGQPVFDLSDLHKMMLFQEVEQSNKLPTNVQRCVSSYRGLMRILRATSRLRPRMESQQQNDLLGGLDYLGHPTFYDWSPSGRDVQLSTAQRAEVAALDEETSARTTASCYVEKRRSIHLRDD